MLRLIHPAPEGGQGTRPPRGHRAPSLSLTPEEVRHFRAALRNTARAYGGHAVLAGVVGVPVKTLHNAFSHRPSVGLVLRVAQAAGMSVEAILGGKLSPAGRCPTCSARVAEGRAS